MVGNGARAGSAAQSADGELVGAFRLRMILAHERPALAPYDQDLWAGRLHYERATPQESLERFLGPPPRQSPAVGRGVGQGAGSGRAPR